jgi:hypothetical protein
MKIFNPFMPTKTAIKVFITCLVLVYMFMLPTSVPTVSNAQLGDSATGVISVSGSADVKVVPDEVIIALGVETSDLDLITAKNKNDERMKRVIQVAIDNGIESKYIQTDYLNIEPRYRDSYDQQSFLGYWVRKSLVVTMKDISKFETVLTSVLQAGANYIHGVEFRTTELRKHRDTARSLAIRAAREKADALAAELGMKVVRATSIGEGSSGWFFPYGGWWGGYRGGQAQNVVQNTGGAPSSDDNSTLALGQISVSATVSVTFTLEPITK